ncbi:MAG: DUF1318 domain-containing protein [Alphaproteobacteria bacterium]
MLKKTRFSKERRIVLKYLAGGLAICIVSPVMPAALAQNAGPLDAPRDEGLVGEGEDGFAIARDGAGEDLSALVAQVNGQRRDYYQTKADEQGVDITAIQEIYAAAIYDNAPVGWWFLIDGAWIQK